MGNQVKCHPKINIFWYENCNFWNFWLQIRNFWPENEYFRNFVSANYYILLNFSITEFQWFLSTELSNLVRENMDSINIKIINMEIIN